jgi:hypothetical protein
MPEVSVRTFLPVALATSTATFIGRLYFGLEPAFQVPALATLSHHPTSFGALLLFGLPWLLQFSICVNVAGRKNTSFFAHPNFRIYAD